MSDSEAPPPLAGHLRFAGEMPIGPSGSPLPTHVFRTLVPGTGLGFAITLSIVEGHAGRTGVESAEGAGSTFRVELPAAPAADPARG